MHFHNDEGTLTLLQELCSAEPRIKGGRGRARGGKHGAQVRRAAQAVQHASHGGHAAHPVRVRHFETYTQIC